MTKYDRSLKGANINSFSDFLEKHPEYGQIKLLAKITNVFLSNSSEGCSGYTSEGGVFHLPKILPSYDVTGSLEAFNCCDNFGASFYLSFSENKNERDKKYKELRLLMESGSAVLVIASDCYSMIDFSFTIFNPELVVLGSRFDCLR